uniref:Major facilitator superfamily (MFS) profile domain-containing protein n=1 Tax=Eutreptiella gymnastica TaxID=73025 RepID=A0A7S1IH36_9EUGL|mmetsp:Transcript_181/g.490  ORF Transcript_181/g.490 Transcript_181/m.490 type:complete len:332 (+) Transcript_181:37-1032(+)
MLYLPEPTRGRSEAALKSKYNSADEGEGEFVYTQELTAQKVWDIFKIPSNLLIFAQGFPGCIPWGVLLAYINDFLSQEGGMSVPQATNVMVLTGLSNGVGIFLGAFIGQELYNWQKWSMPLLMGSTTTLGIIPTLYMINGQFTGRMWALYVTAAMSGVIMSITGGNVRTVLLNVNPPEVRGTVMGIFCVADDVGKGFGPFFAASLIAGMGRKAAFNLCIWMWLPCGLLLGALALTLEIDERNMQAKLALQVEGQVQAPDPTNAAASKGVDPGPCVLAPEENDLPTCPAKSDEPDSAKDFHETSHDVPGMQADFSEGCASEDAPRIPSPPAA